MLCAAKNDKSVIPTRAGREQLPASKTARVKKVPPGGDRPGSLAEWPGLMSRAFRLLIASVSRMWLRHLDQRNLG
jgi:hypothetical protein